MSNPNNYSVGWICAVHPEYVAAQAFLDERHEAPEYLSPHDNNDYSLGRVGKHNVAIAVLPYGEYGLASAAGVARDMLHSFPNIRIGLMVGIGGGAPSPKHDIRLGDVVVGISNSGSGSVFQYDYGKTLQGQCGSFKTTAFLNKPPLVLLSAVNGLMAQHEIEGNQLEEAVNGVLDGKPRLRKNYSRPKETSDRLYKSHFVHTAGDGEGCAAVCGDDPLNLIDRPRRTDEDDDAAVHYGLIASANQLMKDALFRDKLIANKDVLCFEMEAAGLMNHFPCLVIRGICDYSDSHKNDEWQGYAAMTAAAYAKALLCRIAPNKLEAENTINERLSELVDISEQHLLVAKETIQVHKVIAKERLSEREQMCHQLFRLTASEKDATYEWYKDLIEERVEGTCMWFLRHNHFQKWLQRESGPLVVTADPGCGKSVLAKYLIDHGLPRSATICYFFFKDQDQNTIRQALCALLHQLFAQKPELIRHAMTRFRIDGKGVVNSSESLWEILRNAVNDVQTGPVIIVLDALDECADSEFENLVKNIENNFSETQPAYGKLKYLLTCRPYDQIVSRFHSLKNKFPNIRIPGEEESDTISQEINCVIAYRVERLSKRNHLSSEIKNYLENRLCSTSHRTYLWVFFIFDCLEKEVFKKTLKEVDSIIATLPRNINEAYEQILNKSKEHPTVRKALSIILVANRPLTLSEMNVAVSVDDKVHKFHELDLEDENCFEMRLRSWCGLFITIYHGKIYFLHQTARDFLLADSAPPNSIPSGLRWQYSITLHESQTVLAELCVLYLDLFNSVDAMGENDQTVDVHAFLEYSAKNWTTHFREARVTNHDILPSVLRICDENSKSYSVWFDTYWQTTGLQPTRNFTNLMIASYCGHTMIAKLCLENGVNIEAKDTIYNRTPLLWAATEGRDAVVKMMIEMGADITANENGRTPLLWAAKEGHEATVKLLLEAEADTEVKDTSYGQTPLLWATKHRHEAVVKLLLEKKAEVETRDAIFGQTPLMWAAEKGHDGILKLLLQNGADIEAKDNRFGQTPVLLATSNGHETTLNLLLQHGADFEVKNKSGWTPLAWASERRHKSIVKSLLEWSARTAAENKISLELMQWAIQRGDEDLVKLLLKEGVCVNVSESLLCAVERDNVGIVKLLLNEGADVNQRNDDGETPLILAVRWRQFATVELLLSKGSDIEMGDKDGLTPLNWAAISCDEAIVELLLSNGADIETSNKDGLTPLNWAVVQGDVVVVELLLSKGADIETSDKEGQTPLTIAMLGDNVAIVELLLSKGANIETTDKKGRTPLIWSITSGYASTAELLLKKGANKERSDEKGCTPHVWAALYEDIYKDDSFVRMLRDEELSSNMEQPEGTSQSVQRQIEEDEPWAAYFREL